MTSVITPSTACPSCHKMLDAATGAYNDEKPEEGDITICFYCGHIMAFNHDMTIRNLTESEMKMVAGDPRILKVQEARKVFANRK